MKTAPCTPCTRTSCGPAIRTSRSSTTSTASGTARASPPGASSRSSTGARSSTWRLRSRSSRTVPTTRCRCRRPRARRAPHLARARGAVPRAPRARPRASGSSASGRSTRGRSTIPRWLDPSPREPQQDVWIKSNGDLPDDSALHACVVAYASDLTLLDTAMFPHAISYQEQQYMIASLDHAMWFHRPFRADDWLLYHQTSPIGFARPRAWRKARSSAATARSRSR